MGRLSNAEKERRAQKQRDINVSANPMNYTEDQQRRVAKAGADKVRSSSGCAKIFWIIVCIAALVFLAIAFGFG